MSTAAETRVDGGFFRWQFRARLCKLPRVTTEDDSSDETQEAERPSAPEADEGADDAATRTVEERSAPDGRPRKKRGARRSKARREERATPVSAFTSRALLVAVAALAAGAAAGWFGHDAQAKAKFRAESAAMPAGSGAAKGPCGNWEQKICSGSGESSLACTQAKGATSLLTPSACEVALGSVPATLAKVKAERATCDKLVNKLCGDLTPGSPACDLVKERTPSFPRERCDEMLGHYDEVIQQLKQMEQAQGQGMGGPPPGGHPMPAPPTEP